MKLLERSMLLFTVMVTVIIAGIVMACWLEYERICQQVVHQLENSVNKATGLSVRIGGLAGQWWKELIVADVRIYGSAKPNAALIAFIPKIKTKYSPLEVLRFGKQPILIELVAPVVILHRDASGQLNFRLNRGSRNNGPIPRLPKIQLVMRDGTLNWQDDFVATASQRIPFRCQLRAVAADVSLVEDELHFKLAGRDERQTTFTFSGRHDLAHATGDIRWHLTNLPPADWLGYLAPSYDYRVLVGKADLAAHLTYAANPFAIKQLSGQAKLHGASLVHKDLQVPVEDLTAALTFDLRKIDILSLSARILGNQLAGHGSIKLSMPVPQLALKISAPRIELASLTGLLPELSPLGPAGIGSAEISVHGPAHDPEVLVRALVDQGEIMKERLTNGRALVRYRNLRVDISNLLVHVHGGMAKGSIWFTTARQPRVGAVVNFSRVALKQLAAPYLPGPLPLSGQVTGKVEVTGPVEDLLIQGEAQADAAAFSNLPFTAAKVRFLAARGNISLPAIALELPGHGTLLGTGGWNEGGDLAFNLQAHAIELADLPRVGIPVDLTGKASASLALAGNLFQPDSLEAFGDLMAADGSAYGQPVKALASSYRFTKGILYFAGITGQAASGQLTGNGTVGPLSFEHVLPPPSVHFAVTMRDAALVQIPALMKLSNAAIGKMTGRVSLEAGKISYDRGQFSLSGMLNGQKLNISRLGSVDNIAGF
ncbi:MAG: DUF748 domain-containing protein, partial [Cyanobacteria bacterium NC_groundwater_1444_Ag_S-0.65um_54_12]|nr:DUF748 domain-containing protein [Cyanobacteria bacterium NC_groundwater_1444_Ag_S-0.65um_54_12]